MSTLLKGFVVGLIIIAVAFVIALITDKFFVFFDKSLDEEGFVGFFVAAWVILSSFLCFAPGPDNFVKWRVRLLFFWTPLLIGWCFYAATGLGFGFAIPILFASTCMGYDLLARNVQELLMEELARE